MINLGDRYELDLKCAYCGEKNKEIWYAPTSNSCDFTCVKCGKKNFIDMTWTMFKAKKIEDVTLDDVKNAFVSTTSANHSDKDIDRICRGMLKEIKEPMKDG